MIGDARIAVVVPAFDEARFIGEVVDTMPAFVDRVIVVDDRSRDATAALAAEHGRRRGGVEVLRHPVNRGVGAAIVTGYRHALEAGDDVIAVMAGDGQMHPDDLAPLLAPVLEGRADYAKGDRFAHPDVGRVMPWGRRLGGRVFSAATRWAAGLERLSDSQCGYTAFAAPALRRVDLARLWTGYGYPNDLLGLCARAGLRVVDVPVRPVYRGEASGLRPRHLVRIASLVAKVAVLRRTPPKLAATPAGLAPG